MIGLLDHLNPSGPPISKSKGFRSLRQNGSRNLQRKHNSVDLQCFDDESLTQARHCEVEKLQASA